MAISDHPRLRALVTVHKVRLGLELSLVPGHPQPNPVGSGILYKKSFLQQQNITQIAEIVTTIF